MRNTKRSITFKVVAGYLLVAALAALSVWFVYTQVVAFTNLADSNTTNNEKLFLVSDITTELYETENISRRLIQTGKESDLELYQEHLATIQNNISLLKESYTDTQMKTELDSISALLSRKTNNLNELLILREQDRNTNYYTQVLEELRKVDPSFNANNYEERFAKLEPHQRRVLIKLLEFSEEDNEEQLTNRTADSLIGSVKNVLSELETANQQFRQQIIQKENELLDNDLILNQQLRSVLATIEKEEREASLNRAESSEKMLKNTSIIMITAGLVSIVIILVFLFLIIKDVSRSQRYRSQLEEAKTFAESLLKSREQFMAAITHDLRSPLNTLIGYTDLMEKSSLNNKQNHYLTHVKKSSDFILRLVNDLLDLSKLEAGKMLVEKLPFNPKKLIEDSVHNALPGEINKDVEIIIDAAPETDVQVLSDPFRIKQIIANLVTNAYKFTYEGEVRVSAGLRKEIEDSYTLIISVKDSGIGIPKEKQEKIFEEFSQENSKIEKQYGGTGLGLTITKSLTTLLKGKLELISAPGDGSEFIVYLPVVKTEKQEQLIAKPEEQSPPPALLKNKKALVVDDEPSQLALTQELVKSLGLTCESSLNGYDALNKLKSDKFDLVLTDIQMPRMDGLELISQIKEDPKTKNIPVIAISGRTSLEPDFYTKAGFEKSLIKPYKPQELLNSIAQIFKVKVATNNYLPPSKRPGTEYDLEEIYQFSGGDEKAMHIIINAFLDSSEKNLEDLEEAFKKQDQEKMASVAHKMLPMFKQMKAHSIAQKLREIETYNDLDEPGFTGLIKNIRLLMNNLKTEITV
ncbi:MAG: ATP-binding protein [Salegentibacter sp.]|uniref:hybrid sensor histidine kinase/response regulator n=1 Tax=Salegentibacter sp. TaxID=1903072 RepID=UPI002870AE2D|nr:ATP-binding protein [Salegentibacter sp.]MDR9455998.1 ATP-binding protein [Salegentibacter sp.]